MKVITLHAPHGRNVEPYTCPKCFAEFEALFLFNEHVRKDHKETSKLVVR